MLWSDDTFSQLVSAAYCLPKHALKTKQYSSFGGQARKKYPGSRMPIAFQDDNKPGASSSNLGFYTRICPNPNAKRNSKLKNKDDIQKIRKKKNTIRKKKNTAKKTNKIITDLSFTIFSDQAKVLPIQQIEVGQLVRLENTIKPQNTKTIMKDYIQIPAQIAEQKKTILGHLQLKLRNPDVGGHIFHFQVDEVTILIRRRNFRAFISISNI